jgi:hypothetical protein
MVLSPDGTSTDVAAGAREVALSAPPTHTYIPSSQLSRGLALAGVVFRWAGAFSWVGRSPVGSPR